VILENPLNFYLPGELAPMFRVNPKDGEPVGIGGQRRIHPYPRAAPQPREPAPGVSVGINRPAPVRCRAWQWFAGLSGCDLAGGGE
jgi:hypothetical protein